MLTYCLKGKKDTEKVDSKMLKTKNGRPMLPSKCAVCSNKKSKFIKEQEAKGLLRVRSLVVSDLVVSDFRLPAMCRGELSAVIAQLMSKHL